MRSFSGSHTPNKLPPAIKKSPIEINTSIFLEDDLKSFHAMNVIMIREVPNNERLADTVVRTLLIGELASVSKDVLAKVGDSGDILALRPPIRGPCGA